MPAWAQPGITTVGVARDFLNMLRRRDTLFVYSCDGEPGMPINHFNASERGLGVTLSPCIVAAAPPPADLAAYHRSLELGPERVFCPVTSRHVSLALAVQADAGLLERLRGDRSLRRMFPYFKDSHAESLAKRLGVDFVFSSPSAATYDALNDKFDFSRAGARHGFATLPMQTVHDFKALEAAFRSLAAIYGHGCMLRLRRGVGGAGMRHAHTLAQARFVWRLLRVHGEVLLTPFVPPSEVVRNIGLHGIVTSEGFEPLLVTDQIIRGIKFRGGRLAHDLTGEEIEAIRSCLPGLGSWLRTEGYVNAPAGVDGFLMRGLEGLRFVLLDPNIRMTGTMRPWSVVAALSERAGRRFVWQFEWAVIIGAVAGLRHLRQRLGGDLLDASRLEQGGILPSVMRRFGLGPLGALRMEVVLIGRDGAHLEHLRRRLGDIGFRWR